jgi:undecaprenyl-phosphate 4-deoxy-4-formamido-L-arabinose transferase
MPLGNPNKAPDANSGDWEPTDPALELSIVVPVYRSAECLERLVSAIGDALIPAGLRHEIILVNDGSPDQSWRVIEELAKNHRSVIGIDLRRNFGQDNALLTGIRHARGESIAIMDDDLQHDPKDLPRLLLALEPGFDVVYADFRKRHHKLWKRVGSWFNGKIAEWVLQKPKQIYLSSYKVMRREVAELICRYSGPEPYIDGLLLQVTARITQLPVEHRPRYAGESTYTLYKSIRVWGRVAFSFSVKPLRLVTALGIAFSGTGVVLAAAVVLYRLLSPESFGASVAGWASLAVAVLFFGGLQMIFFGVLGEYAGRTFLRVNEKPQTAIRTVIGAANRSKPDEVQLPGKGAPQQEERHRWRRA